jgi:hypothetical protein
VIAGGFRSHQAWISVVILATLIAVFCGILSKLVGMLLGPADSRAAREAPTVSNVAAMSLPLAVLLALTVGLPDALFKLLDQASGIIRGTP